MIKEYTGIIKELKPDCLKRIRTDKIYRGSVLYYLYILSVSCISLAEMVIKHESLPKPQTYFEAIDMLGYKKGDFPRAEKAQGEVLSLPMFPELKKRTNSICSNASKRLLKIIILERREKIIDYDRVSWKMRLWN